LADAGADVAVCDVKPEVLDLQADLQSRGVHGYARVVDVSDPEGVRAFVDGAAAELGSLDVVINNVGVCIPTSPVADDWEKAVADYESTMGPNLRGQYLVGRAAIPYLIRQGGDIVNVTTDHIHTCGYPVAVDHADSPECPWAHTPRPPGGGPAFDLYDASKWGLYGLTHAWARALHQYGVRVNSFGMGPTDTPMYRGFMKGRPVSGVTMTPEQVASVLLDLIDEGPTGRTGDSIQVWAGHPCVLGPVSTVPVV
jgi:NAD(P)-dependent dehydrogenase (short-subunit alcohol dehydrogenase family)